MGIRRYRKKPVVIEAVQLTWQTWGEVCDFVPRPWFVRGCYLDEEGKETQDANGRIGLVMQTLESQKFIASQDDWIIKGVKGEFYPCKPDIFAVTYEPVETRPGGRTEMRVYVAGPYTKGDVVINVRNALEAGQQLLEAGHTPFVPHLAHFWHLLFPGPYEQWLALDLGWLAMCEAVVRLPGDSAGADREVQAAIKLGLPVYFSVEDFLASGDNGV